MTTGNSTGGAFDWARATLAQSGYTLVHEARYYVGFYYAEPAFRRLSQGEIAKRFAWCDTEVQEAVAEISGGRERHIHVR